MSTGSSPIAGRWSRRKKPTGGSIPRPGERACSCPDARPQPFDPCDERPGPAVSVTSFRYLTYWSNYHLLRRITFSCVSGGRRGCTAGLLGQQVATERKVMDLERSLPLSRRTLLPSGASVA